MAEERSRRTTGKGRRRRSPDTENPTAASDDTEPEDENGGEEAQESGGQEQASGDRTVTSELKAAFREAAIEVLTPVARQATTSAAKLAVKKGPELVKDNVVPKVVEAGGAKGIAEMVRSKGGGAAGGVMSKLGGDGGVMSKLGGGGDGDGGASGTGRGRRLPIQENVDVAVPLETAYNQFTQFEDFPEFMHRVERVEQKDDTHLMWHENIWGVRRQWEAEITDQTPNERIAWESTSGSPQQKGVVTFHSLSDRLTRIEVTLDQQPKGLFEKTSSGFRMTRRALKSDLMRFKAFIETRDEETGAWRGEIEEGELVGDEERPEGDEERAEGEEERPEGEEERPEGEEERPEGEEQERPSGRAERTRRRRPRREPEDEAEEPEAEAEEPAEEEYSEDEETEAEADYAEEEEPEEEEEKPKRKPARRRPAARRRSPAGRSGGR